jgi:NifB/MoaA-like Fe-S oxidoreductase
VSFQLRHEFPIGSRVLDAVIASCAHCHTVRVEKDREIPYFVTRGPSMQETEEETFSADDDGRPSQRRRLKRIEVEPPCVSPPVHWRAPW